MKRLAAVRTNAALSKHILFLASVLFQGRALFVRETICRREQIAASGAVYDSSIMATFYRA